MAFSGISYLAVLVATVASYAFGAIWYGLLGKPWMAALGKTREQMGSPLPPMIISFFCQLFMAWMLAGVIGHIGEIEVLRSVLTGVLVWAGFIAAAMVTNHRFQGAPWSLTFIDAGHWLGVLAIQGLVIGLFGA